MPPRSKKATAGKPAAPAAEPPASDTHAGDIAASEARAKAATAEFELLQAKMKFGERFGDSGVTGGAKRGRSRSRSRSRSPSRSLSPASGRGAARRTHRTRSLSPSRPYHRRVSPASRKHDRELENLKRDARQACEDALARMHSEANRQVVDRLSASVTSALEDNATEARALREQVRDLKQHVKDEKGAEALAYLEDAMMGDEYRTSGALRDLARTLSRMLAHAPAGVPQPPGAKPLARCFDCFRTGCVRPSAPHDTAAARGAACTTPEPARCATATARCAVCTTGRRPDRRSHDPHGAPAGPGTLRVPANDPSTGRRPRPSATTPFPLGLTTPSPGWPRTFAAPPRATAAGAGAGAGAGAATATATGHATATPTASVNAAATATATVTVAAIVPLSTAPATAGATVTATATATAAPGVSFPHRLALGPEPAPRLPPTRAITGAEPLYTNYKSDHPAFSRAARGRAARAAAKVVTHDEIRARVWGLHRGGARPPGLGGRAASAPPPLLAAEPDVPDSGDQPAYERVAAAAAFYRERCDFTHDLVEGHSLQFKELPPPVCLKPYPQTAPQQAYLRERALLLERRRYIRRRTGPAYFSLAVFCVDKVAADGSATFRFVWDGTFLNAFLTYTTYTLEDIAVVMSLMQRGGYAITCDAEDAYYSCRMHPSHTRYLGFSTREADGSISYYEWLAAPFGLGPSGFFWSRLLGVAIREGRRRGWRMSFYGDDIVTLHHRRSVLAAISTELQQLLKDAGIRTNAKSVWSPTSTFEHIGYELCSDAWTIRIRARRNEKALSGLSGLAAGATTTRRQLAQSGSRVLSMAPVLGNTAFLHTRAFFSPALESHGWDTEIPTPADVVSSARHLDTVLRPRPARAISGAAREPTHVLASDASAVGIGVVFRGGGSAARSFTAGEAAESSTHREAGGISFAVRVRVAEHAGGKLVAYCDNKGARSVIMYGSHDPRLQRIATGLAAFCHRHDIELIVVWDFFKLRPLNVCWFDL